MPSSTAAQIRLLFAILASVTIAGSWWFAALKKPGTGIFYWLAAAHTVQAGITATYFYGSQVHASPHFWEELQSIHTLMGLCTAALYVVLVNWLVDRP